MARSSIDQGHVVDRPGGLGSALELYCHELQEARIDVNSELHLHLVQLCKPIIRERMKGRSSEQCNLCKVFGEILRHDYLQH